jgi:tetratricopeptide (TPR) repeat protein
MQMNKIKVRNTLLFGMAAVLAWRVLSLGMADHRAVDNPEKALFWRAGHPEALFRMAEKYAAEKKWSQANAYALKAVKSNRLDGRALRVMAQVAEHEGDEKRAAELFNKAVALSPRDLPSHAWLLEYALRNRQAKPAAVHLDALLRVAPELMNVLLPQAVALAVNPAAQDAMLAQLALNPPWRRHLLKALATSGFPSEQIVPVFIKLNALSTLEPGDYLPLIDRLNKENRSAQAYLTWANLIPDKQRKYLGNVFDGGFELPIEEQIGAFGWLVRPLDGAQMQLLSTQGTLGENSFYLEFEGRRTPFAHLSQMLALPPGQWQLSFRAKADRLDSSRGLVWRIVCQSNGKTLTESEPMQGNFNWREFNHPFTIPEDCSGQSLVLMIPARIPAETLINGSIWLDDVKIQRVEQLM